MTHTKPLFAVVGTLRAANKYFKASGLEKTHKLLLLDSRASVFDLWGKRDIPYAVVVKEDDKSFSWISELVDHERAGRIVPWNEG